MSRPGSAGSLVPPSDWAAGPSIDREPVGTGFLLIVTLIAAFLRLYALSGPSLWVDEMLTWQMIRPGIGAGYLEQVFDSIQGPLYMAVVWPLLRIRDSELMLRLPAALAGIITIPVFGILMSRLFAGRAARLAVLLLALNPFHVWYSQEGRGYAFLILFSVLMALMYLEMVSTGAGYRKAAVFGLVSAGAALSNLGGLFLLAAMGLGFLFWHRPGTRKEWGPWVLAFGLGFLLVLPWLLKAAGIWAIDRVVPGSGTGEALRGATTFSFMAWPFTLETFFYGYSFGPSLGELHQPDRMAVLRGALPLLAVGALPVGAGLLAGVFRLDRRRSLLLVWILVPVAILTFLAIRNVKPWNPRYIAMAFPWVLALAAYGLTRLPGRLALALTVLLIGLTLWSLGGYYRNGRYAKADVRSAAAYLEEMNTAGDPMLVPVVSSVFKYYYRGEGEILETHGLEPLKNAAAADAFCRESLAGKSDAWVVLGRAWYFDPRGQLPLALARAGHLRRALTAPGVEVYHWTAQETDGRAP